ncbi:PREDICTED: uncharacterized protein LOC105952490 [Erythranthe guttata]|uniref:uncharacterized protein LOC105952490 n=1 Tax=Erythranthe guttata TaxID=4155 RepID=UPI00064D8F81|nr:PREDICTED: uncharacterized protein LOC105952490 [Erythranthe guttata]|eukprot:XP_012831505.1 PREDICTED: uncharacterized protein LOC105952490 [Erythranthe guttata]
MLLPQLAPPTVAAHPAPPAAAALYENGAATPSAAAPSAVVPSVVAARNRCSLRRRRPQSSAAAARSCLPPLHQSVFRRRFVLPENMIRIPAAIDERNPYSAARVSGLVVGSWSEHSGSVEFAAFEPSIWQRQSRKAEESRMKHN